MGIFSIFKKKDEDEDLLPTRISVAGEASRLALDSEADRARQREIARATAMKIDAIELAMTSDIFDSDDPGAARRTPKPVPRINTGPSVDLETLPMLDIATTELMSEEEILSALPSAAGTPALEEVAVLYANGEDAAAEDLLKTSLQLDKTSWWMLFDLYQAASRQSAFEELSIAYAKRFESSPPQWRLTGRVAEAAAPAAGAPAPQVVEVLPCSLDASVGPQLARLAGLAGACVDVGGVMEATPEGCALLLACLKADAPALAGAEELVELLRMTVRKDDKTAPQAPWMLLLDLLQGLGQESAFEDVAMDYCVSYEVSPPQFVAPKNASPVRKSQHVPGLLVLPALVAGALPALDESTALLVFDCSQLARIDYPAANALLQRLRPLAGAGKGIEFRDVNYLVSALLKLLGFGVFATILPHKY